MPLPRVIWIHIFSFLRARELIRTMTVSKEWKSIAEETTEPFREVTIGTPFSWNNYAYGSGVPRLRDYVMEEYEMWNQDFAHLSGAAIVGLSNSPLYRTHLRVLRFGCSRRIPKFISPQVKEVHLSVNGEVDWKRIREIAHRVTTISLHLRGEEDFAELYMCNFNKNCTIRIIAMHSSGVDQSWIQKLEELCNVTVTTRTHAITYDTWCAFGDNMHVFWDYRDTTWILGCRGISASNLGINVEAIDLARLFRRAEDISSALPNLECLKLFGIELFYDNDVYYTIADTTVTKFPTVKQLSVEILDLTDETDAEDHVRLVAYILRHFTTSLESLCLILDGKWALHPEEPWFHRFLTYVRIPHLYLDISSAHDGIAGPVRSRYRKHVRSSQSNIHLYLEDEWENLISTEFRPNKRVKT